MDMRQVNELEQRVRRTIRNFAMEIFQQGSDSNWASITLIDDPLTRATIEYTRSLAEADRYLLFEALLDRFHPENDSVTVNQSALNLLARWDDEVRQPVIMSWVLLRKEARVAADKRKMWMEIQTRLKDFGPAEKLSPNCWRFRNRMDPFIVETIVDLGSRRYFLSYEQVITAQDGHIIHQGTSVLQALGISGQTIFWSPERGNEPRIAIAIAQWAEMFIRLLQRDTK